MRNEQTHLEELINSISHYFGLLLAIIGTIFLLIHSTQTNNKGYIIGSIIYSVSLILLYTMSGTYHILKNAKWKSIFQILDHSMIYLLISASYTPYLLGYFPKTMKWTILSLQWAMTILGITFKLFFTGKFKFTSTVIYLVMGWMIIFVFRDLINIISSSSLKFLIASGVTYSIGTIFYFFDHFKFWHGLWHLFVLGGSVLGYFSILYI